MGEKVLDAFGQHGPLCLGDAQCTQAHDQALAGSFGCAYRLHEAVIGVGFGVAFDLELSDEHGGRVARAVL